MEEVAAVRRAALDAVDDVTPDPLCERIGDRLEEGSMAPGVLTVFSARAARRQRRAEPVETDAVDLETPVGEAVARRGAGVQLIYEGLRLTRTLAHQEPWAAAEQPVDPAVATNGAGADHAGTSPDPRAEADMAILAADVLVARGFYLLARTEAAGAAVDVVRAFGRDQTARRVSGDAGLDRELEADVFELAVVAGTTTAGVVPSASLRDHVAALPPAEGPLPDPETLFSEAPVEALAEFVTDAGEDVAQSAD